MARIINFSEAASIAVHGMVLIAKSNTMINVQIIAENTSSSKHHVAKVMQRLVKDGYLHSHRGPTGGFSLRKPANEISLLNIYEAIEGKVSVTECPLEHPVCPFDKCLFNNVTKKMTVDFIDYMSNEMLDQYL